MKEDNLSLPINASTEDLFLVREEGSLHKYRTEIPNIIYELGLSVYDRDLYCYLKRVAGDKGSCWQSKATIAAKLKMSPRKLQSCKKNLSIKRKELGGLSLISCHPRRDKHGSQDTDYIVVKDIWPVNFSYFGTPSTTCSPPQHSVLPPRAPHAPKEDLLEEETLKKGGGKPPPPPVSFQSFGDHVKLKEGVYERFCKELGKDVMDYYVEAINLWVPNNGAKKDYAATIRSWHLKDKAKGTLPFQKKLSPAYPKSEGRVDDISAAANQTLASSIYKATRVALKWETSKRIYTDTSEITFDMGSSREVIKYTENAFRERCLTWLRKMGLPVEGL